MPMATYGNICQIHSGFDKYHLIYTNETEMSARRQLMVRLLVLRLCRYIIIAHISHKLH